MGEAGYDKRARWLLGHRVAGVSTAALAFADLILGLVLADRGAGFIAGAAIVWGALVAGFAAKRVGDARKRLRRGSMLEEANGAASAWKSASMEENGGNSGNASRSSATTAGASGSSGAAAAAAEMVMGKR